MNCDRLNSFRQDVYHLLSFAKDATFELMDAVLTTRNAHCLADFSLNPLFRRKWPSIYEALQDCRPNRNKLMRRYLEEIPNNWVEDDYLIMAIDHTPWPRKSSPTLKDRTYQHKPDSSNNVVVGQGYSTIAWIPENEGSWALPLRHERITNWETPISKAAWQLKQISKHLPQRILLLLDSEYGNASWINQIPTEKINYLIRVRSNICLFSAPDKYKGKGRPKLHGNKFKLNDSQTWWFCDDEKLVSDPKLGNLKIKKWEGLHFRNSPSTSMTLIKVERFCSNWKVQKTKPLWLVWVGEGIPPIEIIWKKYLRRFTVDHWYRFAKQRLHWTLPAVSTPQQSERWSDLMPALTWQLWLAKNLVEDLHLPWQKPQTNLTPGRVAQSMLGLIALIGTPAVSPKLRGNSCGWEKGRKRSQRTRYPIVKKGVSRDKKG